MEEDFEANQIESNLLLEVWTTSERCVYVPLPSSVDGKQVEQIFNVVSDENLTLQIISRNGMQFCFPSRNISYVVVRQE